MARREGPGPNLKDFNYGRDPRIIDPGARDRAAERARNSLRSRNRPTGIGSDLVSGGGLGYYDTGEDLIAAPEEPLGYGRIFGRRATQGLAKAKSLVGYDPANPLVPNVIDDQAPPIVPPAHIQKIVIDKAVPLKTRKVVQRAISKTVQRARQVMTGSSGSRSDSGASRGGQPSGYGRGGYQGGTYGGEGGARINQGVGGAYKNR